MKKISLARLACFLMVFATGLASGATLCLGQTAQGEVLGTVTDSSGSVVPKAEVSLINEGTRTKKTTLTTGGGNYTFPYLDSGTYTISVEMSGFATDINTGITLLIGEVKRVDVQLKVGSTQDKVEVTAGAPNIDTDTSTVGSTVTNNEVNSLPIAGREFSRLALEMPGVFQEQSQFLAYTGAYLLTQFSTAIDVGGTGFSKNNYTLDGVDNNLYAWAGPAMNTSLDTIQEMRVDRNNFKAEYGRGGARIEVETKSGTNAFHGSLFEYLRNYALDAGNYVTHQQDTLKHNQFGATVGGPIIKEKLFFFFGWESQRENAGEQQIGTVLTDKARNGDLSDYPEIPIDPTTGQPFPGKVIPTQRLDPVWLAYMNLMMSQPNLPGIVNNYVANIPYRRDWDQLSGRVDYNLSSKDSFFLRLSRQPRTGVDPNAYYGPDSSPQSEDLHFYNGGIGWNRVWKPNLISQTRFGFHHERLKFLALYNRTPNPRIQGYIQPNNQQGDLISTQYFSIGDYGYPIGFDQRAYVISQNVTWVVGVHTFKFGFEGRKQNFDGDLYPSYVTLENFDGQYTGSSLADLLLGYPNTAENRLNFTKQNLRVNDFSGYAQDDWIIRPRLTLNLGLRYDLYTLPHDANDVWGSFDPQLRKIVVAGDHIMTQDTIPLLLNAWLPYIVTANQTNLPQQTLAFGNHHNFAPRIGFAWRPFDNNKTVVRGGYGIAYIPNDGIQTNNSQFTSPYFGQLMAFNTTPSPSFTMGAPFGSVTSANVPPPTSYPFDPHQATPYLQQANLGVERELPGGIVGEINFQDQHSLKLESAWNSNNPVPGPGPLDPREPYYPEFTGSLYTSYHDGKARYDAMELSLKKVSAHYTLWWNHTWSKNLGTSFGQYEGNYIVNPYNRNEFYGPDNYVAQLDKFSFVVDVPVGKGHRFLDHGGVVDQILGRWRVSGLFTLHQSGDVLTPVWNGDSANVGIYTVRPNRICSGRLSNPTQSEWFNTSCFVAPTPGTFGNSGSGIFLGPGRFYGDFSVLKDFTLHENVGLQFRSEFFNVFNHPNLQDPQMTVNGPEFGQILTAISNPLPNSSTRVIEFALRLSF
jgi:outer membrane receptor protein involved in Fe transport